MATAALIAGTGLLAGSQVQEGLNYKAEGQAKKDIAEYNARQLNRQAASRLDAAQLEDTRQVRRSRMALGSQIASGGKSGAVSDVDVLADTAFQFAMDRNLMLRQGFMESQGLMNQARLVQAQGQYAFDRGKAGRDMSFLKAGGSILSGAYMGYDRGLLGAGKGAGGFTKKQQDIFFGGKTMFSKGFP